MKEYLKSQARFLFVPFLAIIVGLGWPSFYWLVIGFVLLILLILNTIRSYYCNRVDDDGFFIGSIGCAILIPIVIALTIINADSSEIRYITNEGNKLHIYQDCSSIHYSKARKIEKLEYFLYSKFFSDCTFCERRQNEEIELEKKRQIEKKKQQEKEDREFLIEVLTDAIKDLREGSTAQEISEELHEFLYDGGFCGLRDFEEKHDDYEAGYDYNSGVPSKYQ